MKVLLLIGLPLLFVDSFDLTTPRQLFAPRALQRTTALQKAKPSESESNSFLFSSPGDSRYLTKEEDGRAKLKSEMLGNGDERSIAGGFHQVDRDEASEILGWDATRLSEELESGEITATALMSLTLARIDELNPTLNAIILLRHRDELLEQARIADASPRKGWLHGIPTAIKDLSNIRRLPTTMGGSPLYPDFVPSDSDPFVDRLLEAGCIVIGKTNAPESGLGSHTFNDRWGTTFNPYSTQNSAGGSSGGAAVALSARMLAFADGSDMMGSLRNPAGWNNVYSIRPTAGLIEPDTTDGNLLPYPISTVGPMARSPRDLARLLETMAGSDRFSTDFVVEENSNTITIAWLGDWGGSYPIQEGILDLCRSALDMLTERASIEDLSSTPPMDTASLWMSWTTIRSKVIADSFRFEHGEETLLKAPLRTEVLWEVKRGMGMTELEVERAKSLAKEWSDCAASLFEKYDILALPTAQVWPFPAHERWPRSINGIEMDTYHRWMEIVVPCSLAGLPCVTLPAGFGKTGLSMGLQIIGPRFSDAKLLSIAEMYHMLTDWPSKQPPEIITPKRSALL